VSMAGCAHASVHGRPGGAYKEDMRAVAVPGIAFPDACASSSCMKVRVGTPCAREGVHVLCCAAM